MDPNPQIISLLILFLSGGVLFQENSRVSRFKKSSLDHPHFPPATNSSPSHPTFSKKGSASSPPIPLLPRVFSLCLPARLLRLSPPALRSLSFALASSLRLEALFDLPSVARATVTQTCSSLLGSKPRSGSADPLPEATLPVLAFTAF